MTFMRSPSVGRDGHIRGASLRELVGRERIERTRALHVHRTHAGDMSPQPRGADEKAQAFLTIGARTKTREERSST